MYVLDSIREQSMYCVGAICPLCAIRGEPNHAPVLPLKNPSAYTLLSFRLFSPKQLFILPLLGWSWISVRADTGASRWPSFGELRKLCAKQKLCKTFRSKSMEKPIVKDGYCWPHFSTCPWCKGTLRWRGGGYRLEGCTSVDWWLRETSSNWLSGHSMDGGDEYQTGTGQDDVARDVTICLIAMYAEWWPSWPWWVVCGGWNGGRNANLGDVN